MSTNKQFTPPPRTDAEEIFARQRELMALTDHEKAYLQKLGLDAKDFSELDFFSEGTPLDILDSMSLEECVSMIDGADYSDVIAGSDFTIAETVAYCLDELFSHIETNKVDEKMIDINEKLLCLSQGDDMLNAITCMGLQLSYYNSTKEGDSYTNQPGSTGEMLNFYHNVAQIISNWKDLDADSQKTLAVETHLLEDETEAMENMMYSYSCILDRVKAAEEYTVTDSSRLYKAGLSRISAETVKMHYGYIYDAYETTCDRLSKFISRYLDDKVPLNEGGRYNSALSVFKKAKMSAFGDTEYVLAGDERRAYEYAEKPQLVELKPVYMPETENRQVSKPARQNKKKTKAQKLAEKRAAKYGKDTAKPENTTEEKAVTGVKTEKTADKTTEKPAVSQETRIAMAEYFTFFRRINDITDESKRKIITDTCKKHIETIQDNTNETIDYAEKLLTLDSRNEIFPAIYDKLSMQLLFKTANSQESFSGTLNEKLQYAKKVKTEVPDKPGIATGPLLPKVGLLLTVALLIGALMIPVTFIQSVIGGLVKIIVVLFGLALLLTTGPGVIFFLPIFIFMALTVFNIVATFVNPFLLIKILLVGITGAFAAYQARDISADIRSLKWQYDSYVSTKNECLPMAEKFLSICKERHMPDEMKTYYERLTEEYKKL